MKAKEVLGDDPEIVLADKRYDLISAILATSLERGAKKWT
jgi:hypothetical protein